MSKRINFLGEKNRATKRPSSSKPSLRMNPKWAIAAAGAAVIALAVTAQVGGTKTKGEAERLKREAKRLQSEVSGAEERLVVEQATLKNLQGELETRQQSLSRVSAPAIPISQLLSDLASVVPANTWLTKLSFSNNTFTLIGTSDDAAAVTQLMQALEKSGKFSQTTFGYTRRSSSSASEPSKERGFSFEITTMPVLGLTAKEPRT